MTIALIGSVTSLLVAAIGFVAAVLAAKIAVDRETARAFALKRREARLKGVGNWKLCGRCYYANDTISISLAHFLGGEGQ